MSESVAQIKRFAAYSHLNEKTIASNAVLLAIALFGMTWAIIGHHATINELSAAERRLNRSGRAQVMANVQQSLNVGQTGQIELSPDPLMPPQVDPFRSISFLPPPPKVIAPVIVAPPPPPKPVAPTFPYAYFGRMMDINKKNVTYLSRDDALIPIRQGEVLDNAFRIDEIGATQIVVTYLPLDEKISIAIRAANE